MTPASPALYFRGSRTRRSLLTCACTRPTAVRGGASPHSTSMIVSRRTSTSGSSRSNPSTARRAGDPRASGGLGLIVGPGDRRGPGIPRCGPLAADGDQAGFLLGVQAQRVSQRGQRARSRPASAALLDVPQGAHAEPGPRGQFLLSQSRLTAVFLDQRTEPRVRLAILMPHNSSPVPHESGLEPCVLFETLAGVLSG